MGLLKTKAFDSPGVNAWATEKVIQTKTLPKTASYVLSTPCLRAISVPLW